MLCCLALTYAAVAGPLPPSAFGPVLPVQRVAAEEPDARWALPEVEEPDANVPEGVRFRWKLNKVRVRVPIG